MRTLQCQPPAVLPQAHSTPKTCSAPTCSAQTAKLLAPVRSRCPAFGQLRPTPGRQAQRQCASAGVSNAPLAPEQMAVVAVEVEQGPANSRRLYAGIDIAAPWHAVWKALTDYEGLADFIPGLAENTCLLRHASGARLLQIGEQSVAVGLKFRARVVLDIEEHPTGLAQQLINDHGVDEGNFPGPRSPPASGATHDITFALCEGDFQAFRGVWRIQQSREDGEQATTRLSYALFVRPQKWMPIGLIQNRIRGEVVANLTAVRAHAEQLTPSTQN